MTRGALPVRMYGLNMSGVPDFDGDVFRVFDAEGLESPDVDLATTDYYGDGINVDHLRHSKREMTIHGNAWPTSGNEDDVWRVRAKLEESFSAYGPRLGGATVYFDAPSPGVPVQLDCIKGGKLHLPQPKAGVQPFEIPLTAPDPRKYSQTFSDTTPSSSPVFLNNVGTYETYLTAVLMTAATDAWFQKNSMPGTTGRITLAGTMAAGTAVDMQAHTVSHPTLGFIDPIPVGRTWWALDPNTVNSISFSGPWRFFFRSAWD